MKQRPVPEDIEIRAFYVFRQLRHLAERYDGDLMARECPPSVELVAAEIQKWLAYTDDVDVLEVHTHDFAIQVWSEGVGVVTPLLLSGDTK
ncbi:MAG: hypothetical protein F4X18_01055 [Acidimicrobiia bacterium]|nr:hypothetical protein [Acidimicrobiia bacterium]